MTFNNKVSTFAYFEEIDFHLRQILLSAKVSVKICVAWINGARYNKIFDELNNRGVNIEVILNDDHINKKTPIIQANNIILFPIKARLKTALMHNKFCIIDDELLITGSFNWSMKAKNSFENIVIVKNDYKLIKQFLHEFEDLKSFFQLYQLGYQLSTCKKCGSYTYNLGIFREEEGKYRDSIVQIWEVCSANHHVNFIAERDEQYIHTWLLENESEEYDFEEVYTKDIMLDEFTKERNKIRQIHQYFQSSYHIPIHAIGQIYISNFNEHTKWNSDPIYMIHIIRSNMFYRKIIPSELDGEYDGVSEIIDDIH